MNNKRKGFVWFKWKNVKQKKCRYFEIFETYQCLQNSAKFQLFKITKKKRPKLLPEEGLEVHLWSRNVEE